MRLPNSDTDIDTDIMTIANKHNIRIENETNGATFITNIIT